MKKKIIPKPGMIVPLPDGNGNLPAEGKELEMNTYWYQRQFDGDVNVEDISDIGDIVVADVVAEKKATPSKNSK